MSSFLSEIVQGKIRDEGPISFRDFMEMALYYPALGYYSSAKEKFGQDGDYFTAPFFSNVYGSIIAKQLEEMWFFTGQEEFTIVEYGAGTGMLCADILNQLKNNRSFYKKLNYCIIEKSELLREGQKRILTDPKICWLNSIEEIAPFTGCVLSNEVLDNFSVHKVIMKEGELMEIFVDYNNGFYEVVKPASDHLKEYFKQLNVKLPNDYCTEINLQAIEWLRTISLSLAKGFVIT